MSMILEREILIATFPRNLHTATAVAIEYRSDEYQTDRLPLLVADLLSRQVALIVGDTPSALAAKATTTTVPIVFVTGSDPVEVGLVASLNRPGGNVTGVSFTSVELAAKQLGLLRDFQPGVARVAVRAADAAARVSRRTAWVDTRRAVLRSADV
jgi:ABC-type uncharacterized transport system substrate-binding protein